MKFKKYTLYALMLCILSTPLQAGLKLANCKNIQGRDLALSLILFTAGLVIRKHILPKEDSWEHCEHHCSSTSIVLDGKTFKNIQVITSDRRIHSNTRYIRGLFRDIRKWHISSSRKSFLGIVVKDDNDDFFTFYDKNTNKTSLPLKLVHTNEKSERCFKLNEKSVFKPEKEINICLFGKILIAGATLTPLCIRMLRQARQ